MAETQHDHNTIAERDAPRRELNLFDSASIIVGIVIGAGIYEMTPRIATNVGSAGAMIGVWLLGGALSLVGALCFAELAAAYPQEGGDYVYLREAFGPRCGFLFAWAQLWVVQPGSVGTMAFIFAHYAYELRPWGDPSLAQMIYAVAVIFLLTLINLLGIAAGKWLQNILSGTKYVGLALVCIGGLFFCGPEPSQAASTVPISESLNFGQAMIFVLFAFSGWHEMAYVGAEIRDPRKNMLRALLLGTLAVTLLYLLANLAFLHALGLEGMRRSSDVAGSVLQSALGNWGRRAIQLLIAVTSLGSIQGIIFTRARIYYAMGQDYRLFAWLGRWNERLGTPIHAMLLQTVVSLALVIGFGASKDGFAAMVNFTTPVFWIFFCLVAIAVVVFRFRRPELDRPYRVPFYPILPAIFCLSCLFMVHASLSWAIANRSFEALWSIGLMILGIAFSFLKNR